MESIVGTNTDVGISGQTLPPAMQLAPLISSMLKLKNRIKANTEDWLKNDRNSVREIETEVKRIMATHDMHKVEVPSHGVLIIRESKTPVSTYKPSDIRTILSDYFGPGGETELTKIWDFVQDRRKREHTEKMETLRAEGHHHKADKILIKKIDSSKGVKSTTLSRALLKAGIKKAPNSRGIKRRLILSQDDE